jgi:hypothetical protein
MNELNAASRLVPMPERMQGRPIDERGWVVPWFVHQTGPDTYDFRVIGPEKIRQAVVGNLCWVCGPRLGKFKSFTVGPMCAVNEISAEPPSHRDCARFSATICPFLNQPRAGRNEKNLPEDGQDAPGVAIKRNPGVCLIWTTTGYTITPERLFHMHPPISVEGFARGKPCSVEDILDGMGSGIHLLYETIQKEKPSQREAARKSLKAATERAIRLVGGDPAKVPWFEAKPAPAGDNRAGGQASAPSGRSGVRPGAPAH